MISDQGVGGSVDFRRREVLIVVWQVGDGAYGILKFWLTAYVNTF